MSLGAEIAMQRVAARHSAERGGAPLAVISESGAGSPGVEAVAPTLRLAWRPAGGLRIAPAAIYDPPVNLRAAPEDARRILASAPILADVPETLVEDVLKLCATFAGRLPDALRAPAGAPPPVGMVTGFVDATGGEAVWLAPDFDAAGLFDGLNPSQPGFVDEFDALARGGGSALAGLRYTATGAEAMIRPVMALDLPDARQLDHALGEGRAVFDEEGACSLAAPRLDRGAGEIGFAVAGLAAADGTAQPGEQDLPVVATDAGAPGAPRFSRVGDRLEVRVPAAAGQAVVRLDISFPRLAPTRRRALEIVEVWTGVRRRHGPWEDWNEAEAQVALEESW